MSEPHRYAMEKGFFIGYVEILPDPLRLKHEARANHAFWSIRQNRLEFQYDRLVRAASLRNTGVDQLFARLIEREDQVVLVIGPKEFAAMVRLAKDWTTLPRWMRIAVLQTAEMVSSQIR